ncbi:TonB-dependent receptor [Phenylobacterium sp. LH3H17]|uniref:TonB-dependent receptor n=1 Tax=Phenylobacterium sp. LH3H17 TaxID=2903901 RepID=UPI0020C9F27B|nr:TonB-dependent receptor [Phenylobacterium sp. LH3H17]UTP38622.1 TonB-dependent receptor [Phenylobacterium sp. LH3H17]
MLQSRYLAGASSLALLLSLAAGPAFAQDAAEVEEVVVTGSFIAGTPEDAALPVNVIGAEEMAKQGSPSTVDLIKSIPAVSGAVGESNQFGAGQTTGSGNVNLRGLGAERTLVLFNGRRMAISPGTIYVDTNLIPTAAIGRIEVLKDGAAATYGSDAIGGVVNFITRRNLSGLEVSGGYSLIDGSKGDYNVNAAYGWVGDRGDLLVTAGYRKRSELSTTDRDFALRSFTDNPQGGWSTFGNPGLYLSSSNAGFTYTSPVVDPGCGAISGPGTAASCQFQFLGFDNLTEDEDHWQFYSEINFDLTDTTRFHAEILYSGHEVAAENSSPSYPPNNFPTSALTTKIQGNGFYIPSINPGLQALIASGGLTPAQAATAGANGLFTSVAWRPLGVGGNPLFGGKGKEDKRAFEAYRISAGLKGKFDFGGGIGWDAALTYMDNNSEIATPDVLVGRMQLALRGLGGNGCTGATPGANGCLWFNPFSSGTAGNAIDGRTNPNYNAATANSLEVLDYIFDEYAYKIRSQMFTADLVFNGDLPIDFGAGQLAWAAGAQYRWSGIERQNSDYTNIAVSPCADSSVNPGATCTARNGPFSFFGALADYDLDYSVIATFAELQMPFTDSLTGTFAIRYEDYGGNIGATTNPKVALKWQAADWLAFRASAGSTFRAPPQTQIANTATTNLAYTTAAGGYRAYDLYGNASLKPEKADTLNLGVLFEMGDFQASLDYWRFAFKGPIDNESGSDIVNAIFPNGAAGANNCANPAFAPLLARISFTGACSAPNINRVRINYVNSPDIDTSGLDFAASYRARDVLGGDMNFGVDLTYVLEYVVSETTLEGIVVARETDYTGTMDYLGYGSQPQWKATAFAEYARDAHNLRWTIRYVDDMLDTRGGSATFATNQNGRKIKAFVTNDITYRVNLPWDTTLTAAVINAFDADPPFARLDLSYDPFTANPLGRYYKLGVTKRF